MQNNKQSPPGWGKKPEKPQSWDTQNNKLPNAFSNSPKDLDTKEDSDELLTKNHQEETSNFVPSSSEEAKTPIIESDSESEQAPTCSDNLSITNSTITNKNDEPDHSEPSDQAITLSRKKIDNKYSRKKKAIIFIAIIIIVVLACVCVLISLKRKNDSTDKTEESFSTEEVYTSIDSEETAENPSDTSTEETTDSPSDTSTEDIIVTSADSASPFEEYTIYITTNELIYKEPDYESEVIVVLKEDAYGAYTVIDETIEEYYENTLYWAKIKEYNGWLLYHISGNYSDDEYPIITDPIENTSPDVTDTGFEPYQIEVLNNCLGVFSQPKLSMDYWLYDITDHRTITIVEIQDVWLYTDYRTWAKLDTGGWVRLEAITDTSNNSNNTTDESPDITEAPPEETTTKEPVQLEGVYIPNGTSYQYIYGCGNKHTSTVYGIEFIWYDRYESRDKNNTRVYHSLDIISLDVERVLYESEPYKGQKEWFLNYEVQISDDISISLNWIMYDKENYWIDDIPHYSKDYGRAGEYSVRGNKNNIAKGVCLLGRGGHYPTIEKASYVELCPHL